jgi:hypothetical protein
LPALTAAVATAVLALVVCLQVASGYWYGSRRAPHRLGHEFNDRVLPVRAGEFIRSAFDGPRRILNNWDSGGYLRFSTRWPVFIDGRNEIMGEAFYREYLGSKDPARLPGLLARWDIDAALVPHVDIPTWFHHFDRAPGWREVYHDDRHAVFVRGAAASKVAALEPPRPASDYPLYTTREANRILERAEDLARPSFVASLVGPHYEPYRELGWSLLYLRSGRPRAAIGHALRGLERTTFPAPELLATLGHAYYDLGENDLAARCFARALDRVDDPLARDRLREIGRRTATGG